MRNSYITNESDFYFAQGQVSASECDMDCNQIFYISSFFCVVKGKIHPEAEFTLCYSNDFRHSSLSVHTKKRLPVHETIAAKLNFKTSRDKFGVGPLTLS